MRQLSQIQSKSIKINHLSKAFTPQKDEKLHFGRKNRLRN